MKCALCSTDTPEAERLASMLEHWLGGISAAVEVVRFCSPEELRSQYSPGMFVFVFLDIESDGLKTARWIREQGDKCQIAFFAAGQRQALACYAVHPAGFLLKPVQWEPLDGLLYWHKALFLPAMGYLTVLSERTPKKILLADIRCISVNGRSSLLHLASEQVRTNRPLSELERELSETGFFRCHRKYLVNPVHITALSGRSLQLDNGETVLVSEERLSAAKAYFASAHHGL